MREEVSTSFGSPHRHFARVGSTNTVARELATAGAPHGTVVTAAEQTAGRGRQGRTWTAPPGSALLYSAILRPLEPRHSVLPLAVPLAVCETAERLRPGIDCKVKWPNDIHLEGRKLAGILIETRPQDGWAVLGIGLNLTIARAEFPPDLRDRATSLSPESPHPTSAAAATLGDAASALSEALNRWVDADADRVLPEWRKRDALLGRAVTWENGTGVADGIDERGYLLVRLADGDRVALGAGDVHLTSF
ncbi:MAG TPA: biotin--[acetyl-CoA-carboxylase] ligase [Solirubrobacterales bacterium]|jgi:BirA family biotin operon repressor/biotin-[acetyl-CoA-carboxylase] ligase|nr:biotin--[acetyl-CoA-carboxylase] ligase [Solirubrobacterales bacterium]